MSHCFGFAKCPKPETPTLNSAPYYTLNPKQARAGASALSTSLNPNSSTPNPKLLHPNPQTGMSRSFGFVNFHNPRDADAAILNINGHMIDGKTLQGKPKLNPEQT